MPLQQFDEFTPVVGHFEFTPAYVAGTWETLADPTNGRVRVDFIIALSSDPAARSAILGYQIGGTDFEMVEQVVAGGSGTGGNDPNDVMKTLRDVGVTYLYSSEDAILRIKLGSAPAAGTLVEVFALGGRV